MQHERRRFPRVKRAMRLTLRKCRFRFLRGPGGGAETIDVSRGGARVNTRMEVVSGDRIVLALSSKTVRGGLTFGARVVWTRNVTNQKGRFVQAGVQFLSMPAEKSNLLLRLAAGPLEN